MDDCANGTIHASVSEIISHRLYVLNRVDLKIAAKHRARGPNARSAHDHNATVRSLDA